jgi:hypothetical protein
MPERLYPWLLMNYNLFGAHGAATMQRSGL